MLTRERERNGQSIEESQERKHDTNWAIHSYNEWAVETEILTCVGYSHDLIRVCAWFYCTDGLTWRFLVKLSCFFLNAFWRIFSDVSATRLEASFSETLAVTRVTTPFPFQMSYLDTCRGEGNKAVAPRPCARHPSWMRPNLPLISPSQWRHARYSTEGLDSTANMGSSLAP